jgi:hypothetical protein
MKTLEPNALKIFTHLLNIARQQDNYAKLDNQSGFMPLYVEKIWTIKVGEVWSLAHYGKQNGDAMADPMMDFLVYPSGFAYPISFRNDYVGIYTEAVILNNSSPVSYCFKQYRELRSFAHLWLNNIREQQEIELP